MDCAARGEIEFYKYYDSYDCDHRLSGDCDFYFRDVKIRERPYSSEDLFYKDSTRFKQDSQTYYPSVTATVDLPSNLEVYLSMDVWDKDVSKDDLIRTMYNMVLTFENAIIGHSYSTTYRSGSGRLTVYYKLLSCDSYYYGSRCSTYCRPVSGSYTCDSNGRKTCVGRKAGSSCQDCQSNYYPRGRCTVYCEVSAVNTCNSAGDKICKENYYPSGQCDTFCKPQPGIYTCSSLGVRVPG